MRMLGLTVTVAAAALLAGGGLPAHAQRAQQQTRQQTQQAEQRRAAEPPGVRAAGEAARPTPLQILLERRDELQLTPVQLQRLEGLQRRLARENEPLVARMMRLREAWQVERLAARRAGVLQETPRLARIRGAAEPLNERIQTNNRAAMQTVHQMLSPEQRNRLREMVQRESLRPARRDSTERRRDEGPGR